MLRQVDEVFIRFLVIPIFFLLAVPVYATTAEVKQTYENYQETIIHRPTCDPVKGVAAEEDCFYKAPKPKVVATNKAYPCNCVLWAQTNGLPIRGYGAAKNYPVNSMAPAATGFVVTYEGYYGHLARYVLDGEWLVLEETNYFRCRYTIGRRLHISSGLIKGYINTSSHL